MSNISKVILVSDDFVIERATVTDKSIDLDRNEVRITEELRSCLVRLGYSVSICFSPQELLKHIPCKSSSIVFPNWLGTTSRNRAGLVTAICEAADLPYIGGDTYVRILCGDKALVKPLITRAGLATPNWVVVEHEKDIATFNRLSLPLVVKLNRQNSSIGMSQLNLARSWADARTRTRELLHHFQEPVIVEEFIPGKEVALSIVATTSGKISIVGACERFVPSDESYFETALFDAYIKKGRVIETALRPCPEVLTPSLLASLQELLLRLGRVVHLRVDGRLTPSGFQTLELSPNPVMAADSEFMTACEMGGYAFQDVVRTMLLLSLGPDIVNDRPEVTS